MIDDQPGGESARRGANPLRGGDRPLRHIVAPGAAHQIGQDQRGYRAEDPGADPVEQLHPDQPHTAVRKGVKHGAHRQDAKSDQQDRLSPPAVRVPSDHQRDRQHDHLRGDDAGRHHRRRPLLMRKCQLLPDQRQQRRIGEVEQHRTAGVKEQRAASQQHPETRRMRLAITLLLAAPRLNVVDGAGRDRQHRETSEHRKERDEQKDRALRQRPADQTRRCGDRDIATMIERRVAAHPASQRRTRVEPQRQCRDRRAEHVANDRDQAVGDHHRPEYGRRIDRNRPRR